MEGILPLWKERGMTSHDCVFKLRKILQTKKIGHTGTLDPDVDGVLPICIGRATKVVEYMVDSGKAYVGEITLGYSTTTEDSSGEVVAKKAVEAPISEEEIDVMMAMFRGEITQIPPMYSAVKVNGKRLYEYARAGEIVERPKRIAMIEQFVRTSTPIWDEVAQTISWKFEVTCGKGTYVRTLAVDLGEKLGYPAHMSDLTRTSSGKFNVSDCVTLAQVVTLMEENQIEEKLAPLEYGLSAFPFVALDDQTWEKVKNGGLLLKKDYADYAVPFVVTYHDKACAIYDVHPSKKELLKPVKVLRNQLD
ncbi:tRNA pseudouridine(55) synthase TruB [Isobaculum melis]|uniref:tRNA pseudouridine synthase B n=1 Tax=Isobaculum melis TaxID=142588 RepID=A0A1H9RW19_9LACT|nr:tRNA pseudouridine(55) synthase TruB [Isobaculum melis]SER76109.1 tRNA pseudouridine synthase B [Isobaculum melis]